MTEQERRTISAELRAMYESAGGKIFFRHIETEIKEGWEKFIALPVMEKTSKAAYNYQARYEVLKNLKEWLATEIKLGY